MCTVNLLHQNKADSNPIFSVIKLIINIISINVCNNNYGKSSMEQARD